jgi:hypothetical protein
MPCECLPFNLNGSSACTFGQIVLHTCSPSSITSHTWLPELVTVHCQHGRVGLRKETLQRRELQC